MFSRHWRETTENISISKCTRVFARVRQSWPRINTSFRHYRNKNMELREGRKKRKCKSPSGTPSTSTALGSRTGRRGSPRHCDSSQRRLWELMNWHQTEQNSNGQRASIICPSASAWDWPAVGKRLKNLTQASHIHNIRPSHYLHHGECRDEWLKLLNLVTRASLLIAQACWIAKILSYGRVLSRWSSAEIDNDCHCASLKRNNFVLCLGNSAGPTEEHVDSSWQVAHVRVTAEVSGPLLRTSRRRKRASRKRKMPYLVNTCYTDGSKQHVERHG